MYWNKKLFGCLCHLSSSLVMESSTPSRCQLAPAIVSHRVPKYSWRFVHQQRWYQQPKKHLHIAPVFSPHPRHRVSSDDPAVLTAYTAHAYSVSAKILFSSTRGSCSGSEQLVTSRTRFLPPSFSSQIELAILERRAKVCTQLGSQPPGHRH